MRTGDIIDSPSAVGLLTSGVAAAPLAIPPLDISTYSQLVQHMASLYRCDPAAVAASLARLTSSAAGHLPLALTAPHVLTSAALASAALSTTTHATLASAGPQINSSNSEPQNLIKNSETSKQISDLKTEAAKPSTQKKYQPSYQHAHEKPKKQKNSALKNNSFTHDTDGALDLSTQGLRSIYSSYRRITLEKLKPKIVEDLWVENDSMLSWTDSRVAAYNPAQKLFMCVDCECVGFLSRVAEHWLGAHANLRVFRCPKCPYTSAWSRCVKMHLTRQHNEQCADTTMWKENATLMEVTRLMQELRTKVETRIDSSSTLADKRFYCPHCPYATDRRDLFTRHENIHKDDKPFHCYLCYKQFNRADHVKKHFVRMHPDTNYDIAKIRKQPGARGRGSPIVHESTPPPMTSVKTAAKSINIPAGLTIESCSPTRPPTMSLQAANNGQRSLSPLPLTIQNLRVHNMNMSKQYPSSPSSPDITVDVVTPDPPQNETPAKRLKYEDKESETLTISLTPSLPLSSVIKLPQSSISIMPNNGISEPKSPESARITPIIPETQETPRSKKRPDKSFLCPYCHWSGTDNWCLKRHMNTHIKPFACTMCEYKAARAERLSTHVLKVHNKRICNKCSFMAETQEGLLEHIREEHHNNPYSRRHTCGICGFTLENQTSLQNHLQTCHAPQRKSAPSDITQTAISPIPTAEVSSEPQDEAQDLSMSASPPKSSSEKSVLMCPVDDCTGQFAENSGLTQHLEKVHFNRGISRCPHCGISLGCDESSRDHWMSHHQDVCIPCVLVFTSIFGAQMWKKVHMKQAALQETSLDVIVSGLSRKRSAPNSEAGSTGTPESDLSSENISIDSDHADSDYERQHKRSRKQRCPKKVVSVLQLDEENEECLEDHSRRNVSDHKRRKSFRCLRCPNKPSFASYAKLRVHSRNRHRIVRKSGSNIAKALVSEEISM